jgi:hypothetical protein
MKRTALFPIPVFLALAMPTRIPAQGGPSIMPPQISAATGAPSSQNQYGGGFPGNSGQKSVQSLLHATDEEWQVIGQLLQSIVSAQAAAHYSASEVQGVGSFGGMFGFGGGGAGAFGKDSFSDPGFGAMGGFLGNVDWTTTFGGAMTNGGPGGVIPTNATPGGPGGRFGAPGGWNDGLGSMGGQPSQRGTQGRGGAAGFGPWGGQTNGANSMTFPGGGFAGMGGPGMGGFGMGGAGAGGAGFGGFGMAGANNPVATALTELRTALNATNAAPETIEAKIADVRQARQKAKRELDAAQNELHQLVTRQQENVLISLGYLD